MSSYDDGSSISAQCKTGSKATSSLGVKHSILDYDCAKFKLLIELEHDAVPNTSATTEKRTVKMTWQGMQRAAPEYLLRLAVKVRSSLLEAFLQR